MRENENSRLWRGYVRVYATVYRTWSRLLHRFNFHHAKVAYLQGGAIQDWCQWCGLRMDRVRVDASSSDTGAGE